MTNLLSIPQIPAGTSITIGSSADFNDQFFVAQPSHFASLPLTVNGTVTAGSYVATSIASTAGLVPGMSVNGFGFPAGTMIAPGGVAANSLTMNNAATQTASGVPMMILPPPLDLTGISFNSMLRLSPTSSTVLLQMTTSNGLMVNGNQNGQFGWSVPAAKLPNWPASLLLTGALSCVMDIQATDITGAIVDLCAANGPIPVTVNLSITR